MASSKIASSAASSNGAAAPDAAGQPVTGGPPYPPWRLSDNGQGKGGAATAGPAGGPPPPPTSVTRASALTPPSKPVQQPGLWQRMVNRVEGAGHVVDTHRVAHLNEHNPFCDNVITTSKYSALSFVPRSLFEQ